MLTGLRSSGDLTADRRYGYGRDFLARGEPEAAADLFVQALERVPDWAAGHFALAEAREAAGDSAGARQAYGRAAELDPGNELGATLHLARLGAAPVPDAPPEGYVRALFDAYADRFETALVAASRPAPFGRVLDAGCGTGLMAAALAEAGGWSDLVGVDLSPEMVARAEARGVYDALIVGEVVAALAERPAAQDLVVAADVLVYLGDLAPFLAAAAAALVPGGLVAVSVEKAGAGEAAGGAGWVLRDSLRFAHSAAHLADAAARAGLVPVGDMTETVLRQDRGQPITGLLALFARPA